MANIRNRNNNTIISGTASNDSIENWSESVTINSGAGNDSIYNRYNLYRPDEYSAKNVKINGDTGNDTITNSGDKVTIDGGSGDDYITNVGSNISINGGLGNDDIYNKGESVTISAGLGNDTIYNGYGVNVIISSDEGNDYIFSEYSGKAVISSGAGNDTIYNGYGNNVIISSDEGNDYIFSKYSDKAVISSGAGNDYVYIKASDYVTINAGVGNDTIYNSGGENVNLVVGSYTSIYSGNDILLTTKNGSVRIKDGKIPSNAISIITVKGDDGGSGSGNNTQAGGSGNIENTLDNRTIYGTKGADALYNNGGNNVYIYGLEGNDKIGNNYTTKVTSSSSFSVYCGKNVSLNGGKGNDEIYSYSPTDHIIYANGDGNDTIFAYYSENDFKNGESLKIHLTSGTFKGAKLDSKYHSDVIISLGNGTITLKTTSNGLPAKKIPITVIDSTGKEFKFTSYDVTEEPNANNENDNENKNQQEVTISKIAGELVGKGYKVYSFISKFKDYFKETKLANLTTTLSELLQITLNVVKGTQKLNGELVKNITSKIGDLTKFINTLSTKNPIPVMLIVAATVHIKNTLDTLNDNELTEKEKKSLNLSFMNVMKESIKIAAKIINFDTPLTKALGGVDLAVSAASGIIAGIFQYWDSKEKYEDDGLPSNVAIKEIIADVVSESIHEFNTTYTSGADDVVFEATQWAISFVKAILNVKNTGEFKIEYTKSEMDYMEWVSYGLKKLLIMKNHGTKDDNWLISDKDGEPAYADDGNDRISNFASKVELYGGHGDDTIFSHEGGNNNTIVGGPGNDAIVVQGSNNKIYGDSEKYSGQDSNDKIWVYGEKNIIYGNSGVDSILISSNNNTVEGGTDKDYIIISGAKKTLINYNNGDGNDIIIGFDSDDTIKVPKGSTYKTNGKDIIISVGTNKITLSGSAGITPNIINPRTIEDVQLPDFLTLNKEKTLITADAKFKGDLIDLNVYTVGASNITAANLKSSVEIVGSSSSNSLTGGKSSDTISGGAGNDTLTGGSGKDTFIYSSGNDVITDYVAGTDKIKLVSSTITSSSISGSDVVLKTSSGNITVQNAKGKKITVIDKSGKETSQTYSTTSTTTATLPSGWKYGNTAKTNMTASVASAANIDLTQTYGTSVTTVDGSKISSARTFTGNAKANSIKGGTGNDVIYGNAGADTLYGGSGNDKVYGGNDNDKLYGDAGNDSLYGNSGNDTLTGGAGNDTFYYETGNDVITDYVAGTDKIKLMSSTITSSSISGSDVVLKTSNGNITVQNGKGKKITVIDKSGKETTQTYSTTSTSTTTTTTPTLPSGWKYGNTAKTNMTASVSSSANVDLNQTYGTSVVTVDGSKVSSARTFTGNAKANSIKGGTGNDVIYGNARADTLYGGSGNDKIYGGNDNDKVYGDAGNDSLYGNSGNDTLTGGAGNDTFYYETGNDVITDYVAGTDKIKLVSSTITSSSISGSDVVLKTSNGNITVQNAKGKKITVIDKSGKETTKTYSTTSTSTTTTITTPTLPSGWKYGNTAKTNMTASVSSAANVDLTQTYGTSIMTVDGSKVSSARTFTGNAKANSIKGGTGNDVIYGNAGADTLYGGSGNDKIYGGNDNDKIYGEAGNDSLYGNSGNDTLTGGAGNDTFYYETGNDVITDYVAGTDKIKLVSSTITSSSISGSDVVLKTSNGNITVQNAKDKKITVIDKSGNETTQLYATLNVDTTPTLPFGWKYGTSSNSDNNATIITAYFPTADNLDLNQDYGKNVVKVDGHIISTGGVQIIGNSLSNSIQGGKSGDTLYGGLGNDTIYGNADNDKIYGDGGNDKLYGNAGNDTLLGGTGNDTLYGGLDVNILTGDAGNDVFVHEGGNDIITDYTAGQDSIKVNGTISNISYKGQNVVFIIGNGGTIIVNNSKGKNISVTDSSNKTQTYSKTLDLLYDCNFMTDEFQIDDISEVIANNYSVGQIQSVSDIDIFDKATLVSDSSFDKK